MTETSGYLQVLSHSVTGCHPPRHLWRPYVGDPIDPRSFAGLACYCGDKRIAIHRCECGDEHFQMVPA